MANVASKLVLQIKPTPEFKQFVRDIKKLAQHVERSRKFLETMLSETKANKRMTAFAVSALSAREYSSPSRPRLAASSRACPAASVQQAANSPKPEKSNGSKRLVVKPGLGGRGTKHGARR